MVGLIGDFSLRDAVRKAAQPGIQFRPFKQPSDFPANTVFCDAKQPLYNGFRPLAVNRNKVPPAGNVSKICKKPPKRFGTAPVSSKR